MRAGITPKLVKQFLLEYGQFELIQLNNISCVISFNSKPYTTYYTDVHKVTKNEKELKEAIYNRTLIKIGKAHEVDLMEWLSKNLKNTDMSIDILNRLKKLKDRNPDIADLIDANFPEVIDTTPYIRVNQFFIRDNHSGKRYLYQLVERKEGLVVKCLSQDRYWSKHIKATNNDVCINDKELYLNKFDFKALLRMSGVSFESIIIVPNKEIDRLYDRLMYNSN